MAFSMIVSLFTSRIILKAIGAVDFGIYNVVGGIVVMFSVISASLSAAIIRYITYELGEGNLDKLKRAFPLL
jgi:O-antigen/teichoic acid export membrane protein